MSSIKLRMTAEHHEVLYHHLFPGDDKEAIAVIQCGRSCALDTEVLLVHKPVLIQYSACARYHDRLDWPPTLLEEMLREAGQKNFAILKMHSHPNNYDEFSSQDNISDRRVFESVYGWIDGDRPHASGIMLPDGRIRARAVLPGGGFRSVDTIEVVGDDIKLWTYVQPPTSIPAFAERHAQVFGEGTTKLLRGLRIAVVGCSGTGSVVIEQLVRLGVGEIILVDPDHVEEKNLNRILGATAEDARKQSLKVEVIADHIKRIGLDTRVYTIPAPLQDHSAMKSVAASDLVIGCMDGLSGRHLLSRLARYYVLPYVDVGVKIEALEDGTINQVAGSIHYFKPDGLDFLERGVFTPEALEAEDLLRTDPKEYAERRKRGYVKGVQVDRPAVISVNMLFAAFAVNEILARLHPFRMDSNAEYATTRLSFSHYHLESERDDLAPSHLRKSIGKGDTEPLLDMPGLASAEDVKG